METKDRDIKELKLTQSFNAGTKKGDRVLLRSLKELGCCRSIVVDRNDNVLIGNRVLQKAIDAGVTKVRVVETMGRELVVVKRMDIDLNTRKAEEIRLTDNLTAELGLRWDVPKILQTMNTVWGFNPRDWEGHSCVVQELTVEECIKEGLAAVERKERAADMETQEDMNTQLSLF